MTPTPRDGLEILRPDCPRGRFRVAVFDFDGTLSLLREGWPAVMTDLMLAELRRTGTDEPAGRLAAEVEAIVVGMNGRPTVVQMQALAAAVTRRGGRPATPVEYAGQYQDRLLHLIRGRYDALCSGQVTPADWAVPGSHSILEELFARGVTLILASGTEVKHVRWEADLLRLTPYFGDLIFAPVGDDPHFSKRAVIEQVLKDRGFCGTELIGFGDGVVETEEVRRVGGLAVAVASEEPPRRGVNGWKRDRLVRAGADVVIADYDCHRPLLRWLFAED